MFCASAASAPVSRLSSLPSSDSLHAMLSAAEMTSVMHIRAKRGRVAAAEAAGDSGVFDVDMAARETLSAAGCQ